MNNNFLAIIIVIAFILFFIPGEIILKTVLIAFVLGVFIVIYKGIKIYRIFNNNLNKGENRKKSSNKKQQTNNNQAPFEVHKADLIEAEFKELKNDKKD